MLYATFTSVFDNFTIIWKEEAIKCYELARKIDPSEVNNWLSLAELYRGTGKKDLAERYEARVENMWKFWKKPAKDVPLPKLLSNII